MSDSLAILVVVRDGIAFVDAAIEQASAAANAFDAEVIVIDGQSTDGTWERVSGQRGWKVRRQTRPGLAAARNEAVALSSASLVAFLDIDDTWLPGKIERQRQLLLDEPSIDIAACLLQRIDDGGRPDGDPATALTPSGCLIRRAVIDALGGFNESYRIAADHEFFARAAARGQRIDIIPEVLLHKHIHASNLSHDRATYRRELADALRAIARESRP